MCWRVLLSLACVVGAFRPAVVAPGGRFAVERPRPLGQSELLSGPLALGTWSWGNKLLYGYDPARDADIRAAFDAAVAGGVRYFDTGDSYGTGALEGRAEQLLGEFRARGGGGDDGLSVGTKLATYPWRLTPASVERALDASLARLGGRAQVELACQHWSPAGYLPAQASEALFFSGTRAFPRSEPNAARRTAPPRAGRDPRRARALRRRAQGARSGFEPRPARARPAVARLNGAGARVALDQVQFSLLSRAPIEGYGGARGGPPLPRVRRARRDTCRLPPLARSSGPSPPTTRSRSAARAATRRRRRGPRAPSDGPRGLLFARALPSAAPARRAGGRARARAHGRAGRDQLGALPRRPVALVGAQPAMVRDSLSATGWRLTDAERDASRVLAPRRGKRRDESRAGGAV